MGFKPRVSVKKSAENVIHVGDIFDGVKSSKFDFNEWAAQGAELFEDVSDEDFDVACANASIVSNRPEPLVKGDSVFVRVRRSVGRFLNGWVAGPLLTAFPNGLTSSFYSITHRWSDYFYYYKD